MLLKTRQLGGSLSVLKNKTKKLAVAGFYDASGGTG